MWQAIAAAALIVGCVVYLVRKYLPVDGEDAHHGCGGCGGGACGSCGSHPQPPTTQDEPRP